MWGCPATSLYPHVVAAFPPAPTFPADWQQLHASSKAGRGLRALAAAAGEASAMHVLVENRLGVEAAMELDFGDRL